MPARTRAKAPKGAAQAAEPAAQRGPGRPPHERDERIAARVQTLVAVGVPVFQVARLEGLSEPTLRRWYSGELHTAQDRANSAVATALYKAALTDWRAAAFWLKCRAGWCEAQAPSMPPALGKKELAALAAEDPAGDWDELLNPLPAPGVVQ